MPNQLNPDKLRVTYAEFADVLSKLQLVARTKRTNLSDVLRQATQEFVVAHKAGKWNPAPYKSPAGRTALRRVTYAEWKDTHNYIQKVARAERNGRADLLRQIMQTFSSGK